MSKDDLEKMREEEHIIVLGEEYRESYLESPKPPLSDSIKLGCIIAAIGVVVWILLMIFIFALYNIRGYVEENTTFKTLTQNHVTGETWYYDINTNIVYVKLGSGEKSFSPYYVVNEEGQAEIAVLGKNYFVE